MSLLQVDNVSKHFGSLVAVDDISMTVEPGELRAIIGPNGAGKTTFFNLISGFFAPTSGRDHASTGGTSRRCCRSGASGRGMARTFQITEIFPELTVRENLRDPGRGRSGLPPAPWLSRADDGARSDARVDELLAMGGLDGQGATVRSASCRTATSARPRS